MYGFSSLCSYLYLDSLTSGVESDETDESVDDTLSSVSFLDSPIIPPSGSASNNFSDDEIDAIPQSTPNVRGTKLVRRGIRTRGGSRSRSASSSGKTQSIPQPGKGWVDNSRTNERRFPFTGNSGVNNVPSDPSDILAVFKTFFPDSMVDKFVKFTNKYANILQNDPIIKARVTEKQKSYFKNWVDVTRDELWVYIAVTLLMGIIQKQTLIFTGQTMHFLKHKSSKD